MEPHLAQSDVGPSLHPSSRSSSPDPLAIDRSEPGAQQPRPKRPEKPNVNIVRFQFTQRLRKINDSRFRWAKAYHKRIWDDQESWAQQREQFDTDLEAVISDWQESGFVNEAEQLAADLLRNKQVTRPGKFKHTTLLPGGRIVAFFGNDAETGGSNVDSESDSDCQSVSDVGFLDGQQVQTPQAQPNEPASEDRSEGRASPYIAPADVARMDVGAGVLDVKTSALPLSQTRQHVFLTTSGLAFFFKCSCPSVLAPARRLGPSQPTHELIPRHVDSVDHFRTAHQSRAGLSDLLQRHGRLVEMSELSEWDVVAHNTSVALQLQSSASEWRELREQCRQPGSDKDLPGTAGQKTIRSSDVPKTACTFRWPDPNGDLFAVFCTFPGCPMGPFTKHPLRWQRGILHFNTHGLSLKHSYQVIHLFGFKILPQTLPGDTKIPEKPPVLSPLPCVQAIGHAIEHSHHVRLA